MSDLGQVVGKVAGKLINAANADRKLKCDDCKKITPHISISYADALNSMDFDDLGSALLGVANDFLPQPLIYGNPYACNDCQRIRMEGGALSNKWNKENKFYLK